MPSFCLDPSLTAAWDTLRSFLNSEFISAFLSALAGAGFGVWGAQRLAERANRRRQLSDALRQANAIVVVASTIANQAMSVKNQHVAPLSKAYFAERAEAERTNDMLLRGVKPDKVTVFKAEMVQITPLTVPIDALKALTYAAELVPGRSIALAAMIEQSLTELSHANGIRTELIEKFKHHGLTTDVYVQNYFGLKRRDGNTDAMFHDSMVAITEYTDDVIFFSVELAEEQQSHASRIRERLLKMTNEASKASKVDFSTPRKMGLIPPKEKYESWLSGFRSQD
ncbi:MULTISPECIES: hypothetical protein [unclassified Pseudoxanthomonas]|uniref:hypothetical protein n=1 Tax=unclassified Pseudoxanthomonas TaxID=2645906 RepID=UPI0008E5088C|nr:MULTISPECIES: hypothetical protein [unclassified Pseudoxanthomonas]SFV26413.1 hypothetical protein SAMN05428990_0307 [Pseudoxanthomonas sp. YR558]